MSGTIVAVDLGATSGRVVLGHVSPTSIATEVVARFANQPVQAVDGLYWDVRGLYQSTLDGLGVALRASPDVASIGVDSWAVDYGLLRGGQLLGDPFHYRDERTTSGVEATHELVSFSELFGQNGLQFLPFNTLYQLAADRISGRLEAADTLLLIPDLFAFWLTGEYVCERTNASTTGLVDIVSGDWNRSLLDCLGIPTTLLAGLVHAGEPVGRVLPEVGSELGASADLDVVAVGSHDTASAVVAVPMDSSDAAYISCGTWGLVGVELERPVLTAASRDANFTNEMGVDGRTRFLRNVMGLWLLNESVRTWEQSGERVDIAALLDQAAAVVSPIAVFDVNDPRFLPPGDMPGRIADHCREYGVPAARSRAELVRSIIESLASAFADTIRLARSLTGRHVSTVHMVGGGAMNELLCQLVADQVGVDVVAGPVEATAIGNVLVQARSAGFVAGDLDSLRALVASCTSLTRHAPRPGRSSAQRCFVDGLGSSS